MEVIYTEGNPLFEPKIQISKGFNFYQVEYFPTTLVPENRYFQFETSTPLEKQGVYIETIESHIYILKCIAISGQTSIIDYLIKNNLNIKYLNHPEIIRGIIENGNVDTLKYLLNHNFCSIEDIKCIGYIIWNIIVEKKRDGFKQYFQEIKLDLQSCCQPRWLEDLFEDQ